MFTNAGMVQFKDVFVGKESRPYKRATSSQKVIRISGKHNDLENVGSRHDTTPSSKCSGISSFSDYFKEEAIAYAWELLTKEYALDPTRMTITVFRGEQGVAADDEARAISRKITGFGDERIVGLGMKDNFWQMGDTGPCGPCTEIHWFNGDVSAASPTDRSAMSRRPTVSAGRSSEPGLHAVRAHRRGPERPPRPDRDRKRHRNPDPDQHEHNRHRRRLGHAETYRPTGKGLWPIPDDAELRHHRRHRRLRRRERHRHDRRDARRAERVQCVYV